MHLPVNRLHWALLNCTVILLVNTSRNMALFSKIYKIYKTVKSVAYEFIHVVKLVNLVVKLVGNLSKTRYKTPRKPRLARHLGTTS